MDDRRAIQILMARAICGENQLSCTQCPLEPTPNEPDCSTQYPYTLEDVIQAVEQLSIKYKPHYCILSTNCVTKLKNSEFSYAHGQLVACYIKSKGPDTLYVLPLEKEHRDCIFEIYVSQNLPVLDCHCKTLNALYPNCDFKVMEYRGEYKDEEEG